MRHGNRLIGQYDGVVGGKVGLTDGCGFCLVTAAEHAGHRLVVVVLRDTRDGAFADTVALLDWAYAQIDAGGGRRADRRSGRHTSPGGHPAPRRCANGHGGGTARHGEPTGDQPRRHPDPRHRQGDGSTRRRPRQRAPRALG